MGIIKANNTVPATGKEIFQKILKEFYGLTVEELEEMLKLHYPEKLI